MKIFTLALASIGLISTAHAAVVADNACFVVSGTHGDHNNAFAGVSAAERSNTKYSFAGYQCMIFNSYPDLESYLERAGLPEGSPVLVLQEAHGGEGGDSLLNSGMTDAGALLKHYRKISVHHPLALVSNSCYSGSIVERKVSEDFTKPEDPSIDRMCMWTTALPGRTGYGITGTYSTQSPYTLEDAYLKNPVGVLSSAAWSKVELDRYFDFRIPVPTYALNRPETQARFAELGDRSLKLIGKEISNAPTPPSDFLKNLLNNSRFILNPDSTDQSLRALQSVIHLSNPDPTSFQADLFAAPLQNDSCSLALSTFLKYEWYNSIPNSKAIWVDLLKDLKNSNEVAAACPEAHTNVSTMDWINWISSRSRLGEHMFAFARAANTYESANRTANQSYADIFATTNARSWNADSVTSDQYQAKKEVFKSIIGEYVWDMEASWATVNGAYMREARPDVGVLGATANVLPSFVAASVQSQNMENPLDQRRRDACRSIQLKATQP